MQANLNRGADVALFIDWENFKISLAVGHRTPNVSALKEEVANHGRIVIAKAYADWVTKAPELRGASQFLNDPPSLYAAGIEPVFVPTRVPSAGATNANGIRTGRIKNSVDVKMTADCIEIAHSYPNIGTFVLVSGDSDFIHVVNALRTMGKHVIVVGISWSTSRRLADQVDTLVLYDIDVDPEVHAEPVPVAAVAIRSSSASSTSDRKPTGDLQDIARAIEEIIRDERKAGGNPLLTSIKQRLMRRYPDFDEKKLGYSGFKRLMARVAQDGNIRLITAGLVDWAIMAGEDIPEGATEATFAGPNARPGRRRGRLPRSRQRDDEEQQEAAQNGFSESSEDQDTDVSSDVPDIPYVSREEFATPEPVAVVATNGQHDQEDRREESAGEYAGAYDAGASEEAGSPFGDNKELAQAVEDAISSLGMPAEPDDGQLAERVSDLVVMANTLEHQEGVSHVAFNFLVAEICDALSQGLEAGHAEITQRWGQASSRNYVSKMLRSLSDGDFFLKGNHSWRDETSGQNRRRRTFNLNHEHALVQQMIAARWTDGSSSDEAEYPVDSDISEDRPETQGMTETSDPSDSMDNEGAFQIPDANTGVATAEYPDDDDEDYESGKEAAEARAETGFISRLFRPRVSRPQNRR
ncbi:MAG: NYN domain-containing protein [Chloroflexi bacterium]|nr:NYN domain-containing protein [Chloroflexota bacterium]